MCDTLENPELYGGKENTRSWPLSLIEGPDTVQIASINTLIQSFQQYPQCFPGSASCKELPVNAGDARVGRSIPESGIAPGEGNGNPLQDSCLGNSMEKGGWWAWGHKRVRHDLATKQ